MRKVLSLVGVIAFGLLGIAAEGATSATVAKKSSAKKSAHPVASAHKKSGTTASATHRAGTAKTTSSRTTTSSKRGKKTVRRTATTWRSRQLSPTADRYKEIQTALASKGYLTREQANGKWDDASTAALKKFQTDQNLDGNGKINSLSLIALGLGPKREAANGVKQLPVTTPAAEPAPPPASAPAIPPPANL